MSYKDEIKKKIVKLMEIPVYIDEPKHDQSQVKQTSLIIS